MSSYTKATDFASKDTLLTGDALKVIKGQEINDEFNAIQTAINSKADLNAPALVNPTATTQSAGDSSTKVATTAFVDTSFAKKASPALTGTPTAPTATTGTDTTQIATTAFVQQEIGAIPAVEYASETTAGVVRIYVDGNGDLQIYTADAP